MTNVNDVLNSVLGRDPLPGSANHVIRLSDEALHLDCDDADHVYLVTVRQIPRIRLPLGPPFVVGEIDGVRIVLVQVALANHVEVTVDAEQGPAREATLADFSARYLEWQQRAGREPPPDWPAEALVHLVVPQMSDDVGTAYRFAHGGAGGEGTEWRAQWSFSPSPPPEARLLTLHFGTPAGSAASIDLPLPPAGRKPSY